MKHFNTKIFILLISSLLLFGCSVTETKKRVLSEKQQKYVQSRMLAKSRSTVQARVEQVQDNENLVLRATVSPKQNLADVNFEWKLPDSAEVVEGGAKEVWSLFAGKQKTSLIKIKKNSLRSGELIFFFAYKMVNGARVGATTNFKYEDTDSKGQFHQMNNKTKIKKLPRPKKIIE